MSVIKFKDADGKVHEILSIKGNPGRQGDPGPRGNPGYTPRKGVDYFTESEIEEIENAAARKVDLSSITEKISPSASSTNKLVSASEMGDAISAVEAKQLYATASQGSFATKAALTSATVFYNADGTVATPTKNDVAYVLADESHDGKSAKYVIASVDPAIVWGFVIAFSDATFTQAQMDAINSGATAAKIGGYDSHVANSGIHVTSADKERWNSKQDSLTPGSGINISNGVISCTFADGDEVEY